MTSPTQTPDEKPREKYRDRPTDDGRHGDGEQEPNEGYPSEAFDPDAQREQEGTKPR